MTAPNTPPDVKETMTALLTELLREMEEELRHQCVKWLELNCGETRPFVASPQPPMLPTQRVRFIRVKEYLKEVPRKCEGFLEEVKTRLNQGQPAASQSKAA